MEDVGTYAKWASANARGSQSEQQTGMIYSALAIAAALVEVAKVIERMEAKASE